MDYACSNVAIVRRSCGRGEGGVLEVRGELFLLCAVLLSMGFFNKMLLRYMCFLFVPSLLKVSGF